MKDPTKKSDLFSLAMECVILCAVVFIAYVLIPDGGPYIVGAVYLIGAGPRIVERLDRLVKNNYI